MTWNRGDFSIHLILCAVAFALGVLIFANLIHTPTLHAAVGIIIIVVAVLSAF